MTKFTDWHIERLIGGAPAPFLSRDVVFDRHIRPIAAVYNDDPDRAKAVVRAITEVPNLIEALREARGFVSGQIGSSYSETGPEDDALLDQIDAILARVDGRG